MGLSVGYEIPTSAREAAFDHRDKCCKRNLTARVQPHKHTQNTGACNNINNNKMYEKIHKAARRVITW